MTLRIGVDAASSVKRAHSLALACCLPLVHPVPTQAQDTTLAHVVTNYLECIECINGELHALTLRGSASISILTQTLRSGPDSAALQARSQSILALQNRAPPPGQNPDSLAPPFRRSLDNYIAQYRIRAAEALSVLGPLAHDSLCAVPHATFRTDIQVLLTNLGCP